MASGAFVVLDRAKEKILRATIDLDTDSIKAALATASWSPTAAYAGTSTDARYADIGAAEVASGAGYTTGGVALTGVTLTRTGGSNVYTSNPVTWNSATFTAKYIVLYDNTTTNKDIIGYAELESGSTVSPSNGTLTYTPNATNGYFTVA
jgi:hypothetical protein